MTARDDLDAMPVATWMVLQNKHGIESDTFDGIWAAYLRTWLNLTASNVVNPIINQPLGVVGNYWVYPLFLCRMGTVEPRFIGDLPRRDALPLVFQILLDDQQSSILTAGATGWLQGASIKAGDGDQILPGS